MLRELQRHKIPIDVMVGVSAGAIIAAYFAGVGLTTDEMIGDAPCFKGRHLLMHGLTLRAPARFKERLRRYCGVIPRRLRQLEAARFDRLHHGIQRLGIVCHDVAANKPFYFSTLNDHGVRLCMTVKASASIPGVLPAPIVSIGDRRVKFSDGGLSDSLPVDFVRSPELGATHIIVSDCRMRSRPAEGDDLVYIKPALEGCGSFMAPRATLMAAVRAGEAAVTPEVIARIRAWLVARAVAV